MKVITENSAQLLSNACPQPPAPTPKWLNSVLKFSEQVIKQQGMSTLTWSNWGKTQAQTINKNSHICSLKYRVLSSGNGKRLKLEVAFCMYLRMHFSHLQWNLVLPTEQTLLDWCSRDHNMWDSPCFGVIWICLGKKLKYGLGSPIKKQKKQKMASIIHNHTVLPEKHRAGSQFDFTQG